MIVHDVVQRSPQWHALRLGKLCGSRAGDMMATIKTGEAAARRDLRTQIVLERITGCSQESGYVNADMQRGIDKEPEALLAYEALTGHVVMPLGFAAHEELAAGCSPDGIVNDGEGLVEVKCPKSATHLFYLRAGVLPKEYLYQVVHGLWITGAAWADFVSFDDRFPPPLRLLRVRMPRRDVEIASYLLMVRAFLSEVDRECEELAKLVAEVAA